MKLTRLFISLILIAGLSCGFATGVKAASLEEAKQSATKGSAISAYDVGVAYFLGRGAPLNSVEAAKWFQKSADKGYVKAQRALGNLYARGEGVEKNFTEAFRWWKKAADKGDAVCCLNLAVH